MRIGAATTRARTSGCFFICLFLLSVGIVSLTAAAEKTEQNAASQSIESFNLILPFKDLTVDQGQAVSIDVAVVNRRREPVEVSLSMVGVPRAWDVICNSRHPG